MALTSPTLDNRSYEDLREELLRRIPVYVPEWTNHNESDPGIALLELFAHLGESLLFRFNQIPDTSRIAFLRMLGVQPRPARPAHVMLAVSTDEPKGLQLLKGSEATAGAVSFETEDEVYAWPLEVVAAGKTPRDPDPGRAGAERSADALARADVAAQDAQFYETTTVSDDPLSPGAATVDVSAQVDGALWVALLNKPTTDVTELADRVVFLGIAFDERIDPPVVLEALDAAGAEAFHADELTADPPPMLWRLWNGAAAQDGTSPSFDVLDVVGDTTRGMVTDGVVKLVMPAVLPLLGSLPTGGPDSPPPLTDEALAARVVAWLQVTRPSSPDIGNAIRTVRWVGVNAVGAEQARSAAPELLGSGTGDTDQTFALSKRPVLAGTLRLQVDEAAGWTDWDEVDSFVGSSATDRHFTVDLDAGTVHFGRGRVPQIGERIRATSYRYGGGLAGNVAARAISALTAVSAKVANPLPAVGGADRVSLVDAMDAVPAEVHRRDRAVVDADFRDLAEQVTGVARAETLRLLHPDNPLVPAAGVVSVVVFPGDDLRDPNAPMPDLDLLRRTARHLDARRLLTTELYVIPPEYVRVSVSIGVRVRDGYQVDAVRRWVELIVRQYLAPLPPFGPDARGWPLGRAVRRAELEAVAVQVEGVEFLEGLLLATFTASGPVPQELVTLQRWQVPELAEVTVVSGQPLEPGTAYEPGPPAKVPVPLPPDVC